LFWNVLDATGNSGIDRFNAGGVRELYINVMDAESYGIILTRKFL